MPSQDEIAGRIEALECIIGLTPEDAESWLALEPDDPDPDDDGGGEPLEPPLAAACDEPDARGPPLEVDRPPGVAHGQATARVALGQRPQHNSLTCVGCGRAGRAAVIVYDRSAPQDPRPIVRPTFGWGDPPKTVLLCDRCRAGFKGRRRP